MTATEWITKRSNFLHCSFRGDRHTIQTHTVVAWTDYMAYRYGGTCYPSDKDEQPRGYDWGQAIARHQFGLEWDAECSREDLPNDETVRLCLEWAEGKWPEWAEPLPEREVGA